MFDDDFAVAMAEISEAYKPVFAAVQCASSVALATPASPVPAYRMLVSSPTIEKMPSDGRPSLKASNVTPLSNEWKIPSPDVPTRSSVPLAENGVDEERVCLANNNRANRLKQGESPQRAS